MEVYRIKKKDNRHSVDKNSGKDDADGPKPSEPISPARFNYKIPVEIVRSSHDFTVNKKIKFKDRIDKIHDIDWSIQTIQYQINLRAGQIWVNGSFTCEITFTMMSDNQVHMHTIQLPWKTRISNMDYIVPPILPKKDQKKEFDFYNSKQNSSDSYFEQIIFANEPVNFELISTKIVTSYEIELVSRFSFVELDVLCELDYRILQAQFLKYNP